MAWSWRKPPEAAADQVGLSAFVDRKSPVGKILNLEFWIPIFHFQVQQEVMKYLRLLILMMAAVVLIPANRLGRAASSGR